MQKRKNVYVNAVLEDLPHRHSVFKAELLLQAEEGLHRLMLHVADLPVTQKNTVFNHARDMKDELWTLFTIIQKLRIER